MPKNIEGYKNQQKQYTPPEFRDRSLPEYDFDLESIPDITEPSIIRKVPIIGAAESNDKNDIILKSRGVRTYFRIPKDEIIVTEDVVSALEYFKMTIEKDDQIDVVLLPGLERRIASFWIHINYLGSPSETRSFKNKDDGLFAFRTKFAEKIERKVALELSKNGHKIAPEKLNSPGVFNIYYEGKGDRKPDVACECCGLKFEVKSRRRDRRYRISHSQHRPFGSENLTNDWHVFYFHKYNQFKYVPNKIILDLLDQKKFTTNSDRYDAWADLNPKDIEEFKCPPCAGSGRSL